MVTSETKDNFETLTMFKEKKFPILCVVGMAREGFDAPPTEVLIDLAHNIDNARLTAQKIGRGLRIDDGKESSRYYFPDTLDNYVKIRGTNMQLNPEAKKRIAESILNASPNATPEMIAAAEKVAIYTNSVNDTIADNEPTTSKINGVENFDQLKKNGKKRIVTVTSTSLLIDDAKNDSPLNNIESTWLFDNLEVVSGDQTNWEFFEALPNWEQLVKMCINNKGMKIEEAYNVCLQ
jgi:superfamily II DNA or RNA helicase